MMRGVLLNILKINILLRICFASNEYVDEEQGFCEKTDEGVVCVTGEDLKLTRLDGGKVGDVRPITVDNDRVLKLKTLNTKPLVFEIEDFLTDEECEHFIEVANKIGMKSSQTQNMSPDRGIRLMDINADKQLDLTEMKLTIENGYDIYLEDEDVLEMYRELKLDPNNDTIITKEELEPVKPSVIAEYLKVYIEENPEKHSRYSKQAWLFPDQSTDEIFKKVQERVSKVTELPLDLVRLSDFQVVSYGVKGHYNAHTDSSPVRKELPCCDRGNNPNCRICRYMTVLFYLNDVAGGGETAFPFANKESINHTEAHLTRVHHLYRNCQDASVRVPAKKRKAVIWYNHLIDEETGWMGDIDDYTLHGGCPVTEGEKWVANFWIKTNNDKSIDIERMKKLSSTKSE